jgi:hypothetical protein
MLDAAIHKHELHEINERSRVDESTKDHAPWQPKGGMQTEGLYKAITCQVLKNSFPKS